MKIIRALITVILAPVAFILAICMGFSYWFINHSGIEFVRTMTPQGSTVSELRQFEQFKDVNVRLVNVTRIDTRK